MTGGRVCMAMLALGLTGQALAQGGTAYRPPGTAAPARVNSPPPHPSLLSLSPGGQALLACVVALLAGVLVDQFFDRVVARLVKRTQTTLDDQIVAVLRRPVSASIVLIGAWYAVGRLGVGSMSTHVCGALLASTAVVLWTGALLRLGSVGLKFLSDNEERWELVNSRTLPVFDIGMKAVVLGGAVYFLMLAWNIDVTGWLASAGIVGIAVGFAAKDTLANLFAGLFIIADAPYKLGDYLVLDDGTRGRVTEIGLRSTRLLTRDDVEIIVPNSTMANARIINESGGPYEHERVRCAVDVAYGSDLGEVRRVLMEAAARVEQLIVDDPRLSPRVRFRAFGDSGIRVEVLGWIRRPELRGQAVDALLVNIYDSLNEAGIEIPFPQRSVHFVHEPQLSSPENVGPER